MWTVYCRIWNDVGLTAPGSIIYQWYKRESTMSLDEHAFFMDAVIHYDAIDMFKATKVTDVPSYLTDMIPKNE